MGTKFDITYSTYCIIKSDNEKVLSWIVGAVLDGMSLEKNKQ
jgi:hypothetical protein